jgi:hypothetical protein
MLANPFRDIGLRRHHALLDGSFPGVLKILLLAIRGIGDGADRQDDFNQSALLDSNAAGQYYAQLIPAFQNFAKNRAV